MWQDAASYSTMDTSDNNLCQQKVFIFSGFASVTEFEKLELIHKLQSLGGFYCETESFRASATHLIACQPSLSQKFLGACAAGKWILLPKYINDSFQAGAWLPEDDYEWHEDNTTVNSGLPSCMYSAPRQCRGKVTSQKAGMFSSWKVAVLLQDKRRRMAYTRILELGDAQIIKCKLEAQNFFDRYKDLTFLFIEKERKEAAEILLMHEMPFVVPDYVRNFLLRDPPPSHQDFIISNYQPKVDYFIKFASRIFSGSSKNYWKVQLKPLIQKLKLAPEFIESFINHPKNTYSENEDSGTKNMERMEYTSVENKINVTQELALSSSISNSVKLPGLNRAVYRIAKSKETRKKRLKRTNFNTPIRKKKFCRESSTLSALETMSPSILSYFKTEEKPAHLRYETVIQDSSEVSDVIKKKWKLHLQRRNFGLPPLPAYLFMEKRKFLESSEVSSSFTALIESSQEEEEYENAIDIANSFLSYEKYPQPHTLSEIAYKVLQLAEEERIATKAYSFLHKVLYLHPPLDLESRQYYIKALFPSVGEDSLWRHLVEVINSTKFMQTYTAEVPQSAKSKQLLLSFIVTVLEQDFQVFLKSCLYPPSDIVKKYSRPLVVSIFWNKGDVGSVNHNCQELFSLLAKSLSINEELEFQKDVWLCLQHLLTLVAECCQLSQREQKVPEISPYLGPHCDKFTLAFVVSCTGALSTAEKMRLLLTTLQPQWLKLKMCLLLLDRYLTKWEFKTGNDKIPLSLRKIVQQYMFTTPLIRRHSDSFQEDKDMKYMESRKKFRTEDDYMPEGKLLLDEKASSESIPVKTAFSSDMKSCMEYEAQVTVKHNTAAGNSLTKEPLLASVRLLTSEEVRTYLLLILHLLLSYLEMYNIHSLLMLLQQVVAEKEEILQDKKTAISDILQAMNSEQSLRNDMNSKERDENEKGIIYSLLKRYLTYEPSLDTALTVADDLYVAKEFHKYQTNFNEHVKTLCVENVNLPKSLLSAILFVTL